MVIGLVLIFLMSLFLCMDKRTKTTTTYKSYKRCLDDKKKKTNYIVVHCTATKPEMDIDAEWVRKIHRGQGG